MPSSNRYMLTVEGTDISREFEIPSDSTFEDLSEVIQVLMGWNDVFVHRILVADAVLGTAELLLNDDDSDFENEYLLSDFDGEDIKYEYGEDYGWKLTVAFKGKTDEGDGRAHVTSFTSLSPRDDFMSVEVYNTFPHGQPSEEYDEVLQKLNSFVEGIDICTVRGGKYIDIPKESMKDIWAALTSADRFELCYDIEQETVCAVVSSPKVKKVGWKKVLSREVDSDPERFIPIRNPDNLVLFDLALKFKTGASGRNSDRVSEVHDAESFGVFQREIKRFGLEISWRSFLDSNKDRIMKEWCRQNNVRAIDQDVMSKAASRMGVDLDDEGSMANMLLDSLQYISVAMEPFVCQWCGRPIRPQLRSDLPPSTIVGMPFSQCSAKCECGEENVLSYLNDGYHSGYTYRGTHVPWYDYQGFGAVYRDLPSKIVSDEDAIRYIGVMEEAVRCFEMGKIYELDKKIGKYFQKVPPRGSLMFDQYVRYVNLCVTPMRGNKKDPRLVDLVRSEVPLDGAAGAEAYAHACEWTDGYEGYPEKTMAALSDVECDPYIRGHVLSMIGPLLSEEDEPEGYGDMLVATLDELIADLSLGEFRRHWMISIIASVVDFASEHAHRQDDWKRVLPLLTKLEMFLRESREKVVRDDDDYDDEEDDDDDDEEDDGRGNIFEEAFSMAREKWKPSCRINGLFALVSYKIACYYLTDGGKERKGFSYVENLVDDCRDMRDLGPVTASVLVLSEALAYRSDGDYDHIKHSVTLLSDLPTVLGLDPEPYTAFLYEVVSDRADVSYVSSLLAGYGLPIRMARGRSRFDGEILWEFPTYGVL